MNTIRFFPFYRKHLLTCCLVAITGWLAGCGGNDDDPAPAGTTYNISATLSGANEIPANTSSGSGTLTGTYDAATYKLSYKLTFKDLAGTGTAAHFHGPATATENASVAVGITSFPAGTSSGNVSANVVITAAQGADLIGGKWYVNVHSSAYGAGEIRGQVVCVKAR